MWKRSRTETPSPRSPGTDLVLRIFDNMDLDILLSPRKNRELELMSAPHTYTKAGRYTVAVRMIDIFGNDTKTLMPVTVG